MVSVDIPRFRVAGSQVRLKCNYDMGKEKLYAVKWYKDGSEFYRLEPRYFLSQS